MEMKEILEKLQNQLLILEEKKLIQQKFFRNYSKINYSKFKHPATRVFQALRIYVNEELKELREILKLSLHILNNNSRIIIVSFSLARG